MRLIVQEKKYHNQLLFKNTEVSFQEGINLLIGPSGIGKTTVAKILTGTETYNGALEVNNSKIKNTQQFARDNISYVFQDYKLIDELTSRENIKLYFDIKGTNSDFEENLLMLSDKLGITELLNQKVRNLSGGEKQRVGILRALITDPKIIICDEPTANLDAENAMIFYQFLSQIKDKIIILISHDPKAEQFAHNIIKIHNYQFEQTKPKIQNEINIKPEGRSNFNAFKYTFLTWRWKLIASKLAILAVATIVFCFVIFGINQSIHYFHNFTFPQQTVMVTKTIQGNNEQSIYIDDVKNDNESWNYEQYKSLINNEFYSFYEIGTSFPTLIFEYDESQMNTIIEQYNLESSYDDEAIYSLQNVDNITLQPVFNNGNDVEQLLYGSSPQTDSEIVIPLWMAAYQYENPASAIGQAIEFEYDEKSITYEVVGVSNLFSQVIYYSPTAIIDEETINNAEVEIQQIIFYPHEDATTNLINALAQETDFYYYDNLSEITAIYDQVKAIIYGIISFLVIICISCGIIVIFARNSKNKYEKEKIDVLKSLGLRQSKIKQAIFYEQSFEYMIIGFILGVILICNDFSEIWLYGAFLWLSIVFILEYMLKIWSQK